MQARCQDREVSKIDELQQRQLQEKQDIFDNFLPDSMLTSLNAKLSEKEREEIEQLKKDLEQQNAARIAEMKAEQDEFEQELAKQKQSLEGLGDLEKQLKAREDRRKKFEQKEKKDLDDRQKAIQEIAKLKEEMDKDVDEISKGLTQEKVQAKERLEDKLKARKQKKKEVAEQREAEEKERALKEAAERDLEIQRIKELRVRKQELEKTLAEG